mmetsp:Transcript_3595/g.10003  ORF Transcript_3595/g.10003 Transcript_3595/m.10003 type:complete len:201 (+) Transcript_3595:1853-2455(+)
MIVDYATYLNKAESFASRSRYSDSIRCSRRLFTSLASGTKSAASSEAVATRRSLSVMDPLRFITRTIAASTCTLRSISTCLLTDFASRLMNRGEFEGTMSRTERGENSSFNAYSTRLDNSMSCGLSVRTAAPAPDVARDSSPLPGPLEFGARSGVITAAAAELIQFRPLFFKARMDSAAPVRKKARLRRGGHHGITSSGR